MVSRGGELWADSRNVAAYFQKEHKNVLRDIDKIVGGSSNLGDQNFQEVRSFNPAANKVTRHFEMTKRGFTLLIFGWEGEKAMAFKIAYLDRFEAMEKALREPRGPVLPDFTDPAEAARAWAVEFEGRPFGFGPKMRRGIDQ